MSRTRKDYYMRVAAMSCAVLLAPLLSPAQAEDWLQFHENPLLTGVTNNTAPGPVNPVLLWSFTNPAGLAFSSSPAIHDGQVYVGCDDFNLYCFDEFTGAVLWTYPTNGAVFSSPAVAGGNVYFGSMDGNLYGVTEAGGVLVAPYPIALCGPVWGSPTIVGNDLYIVAQSSIAGVGGQLYSINRITGAINWTRVYSGLGMTPLANSYVAVDQAANLTFSGCHDNIPAIPGDPTLEANGTPLGVMSWQYYDPNGGFVNCNGAAVDPTFMNLSGGIGQLVFGQHSFGNSNGVVALDELTGAVMWTALPNTNSTSTPAIHDGQVFIGADDWNVYGLDELTGAINWATPTGGQVWSAPAVAGGMVFVGSQDHNLYCLDEVTGAINWTYFTGPCRIEASPAVADRIVFIGDSSGTFYAITTKTGVQPEYKWYQPPEPATPNAFLGWNELSWHAGTQIVADDWPCNNPDPIVSIRWWGSYIGWADPTEPPVIPAGFHIAFWTDVPASGGPPEFSHPGQVVYQFQCIPTGVFVGWDYDPRNDTYEAMFEYQCLLPDPFVQDPGENIYWVSIAAKYPTAVPDYPWGWKTRPHMFQDDAVRIFNPTDPTVDPFYHDGEPIYWPTILDSWDMAFELTASTIEKYSQPPDFININPPQINGWDDKSVYELGPAVVADDWPCDDTRPVSDVHWWGSYYGWDGTVPPLVAPDAFHLGIWTDKPANPPDEPFSHPDTLIWEYTAYNVIPVWIGTDISPRPNDPQDSCFYFTVDLPTANWFYQGPDQAIYWLSISAIYDAGATVDYPFGWKTRPWMFQDDAVRIFDPLNPSRLLNPNYIDGEPIEFPAGTSWDTAFRLTTPETSYVKWSQPPEPYDPMDHYWGWDEFSVYSEDTVPRQIVADDWPCLTKDPVSDVHFWGSYIGWNEPFDPPVVPDAFHLGIWTDTPANPPDEPFSHPDRMIWEYVTNDYTVVFDGWDLDPRDPLGLPHNEACFRFDVDLPIDDWFWQDPSGDPTIYWLSVSAVYPAGAVLDYPWGWKTRPHFFQDDAVRIFNPTTPVVGDLYVLGEPIHWPDAATSWDVAFALTTLPCVCGDIDRSGGPVDLNDFATFALCYGLVAPNPPGCDAAAFQCSDMDGNGVVNLGDFATFATWFGLTSSKTVPNCTLP